MYDRILVPTDGSPEVETAIEHAIEMALLHDAVIEAVYVVDTTVMAGMAVEGGWDGIHRVISSEGEHALETVREMADARGIEAEGTVLEGSPARRIVEHAKAVDADVIVMGTHGRGGLDRLLLGSVAERVVRCSTVPVVTVRVDRGDSELAALREDVWMVESERAEALGTEVPTAEASDPDPSGD